MCGNVLFPAFLNIQSKICLNEIGAVFSEILTEDISADDLEFGDGAKMMDFLREHDPEFFERNKEFFEGY